MDKSKEINIPKSSASRDYIIFGEDLARHAHCLEHILKYSFESNRFIWVETIGLRSPRFTVYDLKRVRNKFSTWIKRNKKEISSTKYPSVIRTSPIMIPYNQFKLIRCFNKWSVKRSLKRLISKHNFKNIITISSVPQASEYIDSFASQIKVYFCVDDFLLWPGINHYLASEFEKSLIEKSDIILATAHKLAHNKSKTNKKTQIISHGVDFHHFDIGKKSRTKEIEVAYFGLIDERMDLDIVFYISKSFKNIQISLIGDSQLSSSIFSKYSNIKLKGKIKYEDLPHEIRNIDIFILPYKINDLTLNVNPLKLKEYLATSRMTISTRLPEVELLKEHLYIADSPEDFITYINHYIESDDWQFNKKTKEYIQRNETWVSKNMQLNHAIESYNSQY